ncbi:PREDICTED: tyrosine-protein kinase transmembrane receptor Ror-like isoform X1 [Nicrophorus vespilloides]|uniref:Tyrosine-protein kinase transmembrane receptor Ror-like isoform X1 n=1 Tax=Nicrophorus vespilloides TaxID=110193 RepID=A0ABM1MJE6_NICVS|nr:PREDICTED: tyrosine-protein kinase transmembrane receptor Ror-like isoform X1 [Nicrophorus vespilloides]
MKLEGLDRGFYTCVASKGSEKIASSAFVEVIDNWAANGGATGDIPTYRPVFGFHGNDDEDAAPGLTTSFPHAEGSRDFLSTIPNPALPSINEQTVHNPDLFDAASPFGADRILSLPPQPPAVYNRSQPFCQPYEGTACRAFLAHRHVFVQPPLTQEKIEENLENALLVVSQSNDVSSICNKFVLPTLCYSSFPICSEPEQTNNYQQYYINKHNVLEKNKTYKNLRNMSNMHLQRICRQDCILLETELCRLEYSIAKRHPVIGTLDLEECELLPEEDDTNSAYCLKLDVDQHNIDENDKCYWDNGRLYRGVLDVSITNTKCIRWAHHLHVSLANYPELVGHNYCRNPGGLESEPYCYVEKNKREICGIKKCSQIVWMYIIGGALIFVTLAVFALMFYCCKKKNKNARTLRNMSIPTADKNIYGNGGPSSPMEMNTLLPTAPPLRTHHPKNGFQNVPQYTYKEVAFVEELGEGAFGKVYKGELRAKGTKTFVAVKSLKENASAKTQADFQREIELISELKHPNIICLLGVVMKQEPMCMLFEYMSEGDLHEFLIANSPNDGKCLTQVQFLHISIQIAQGMEYLSENHYVHRDLAARNCLVSKDLVVKISDFGLSRDMYSCDYYRVQSKSLLPVRWMPPESILYGKFTTESDVWSYGVVLWEIYSYGLQPYYGYNNQEVINMIRSRKLLPCPDACPSYCYALMVECWAELAIRRPSFGEISHRLRVWKQNGAYFKTHTLDGHGHPQRYGHSSKSSHTSGDSQTVCPTFENHHDPSLTWERSLKKTASSGKLDGGSQSSLTSRSSLGNKTQSTNLSDQNNATQRNSRKSIERKCVVPQVRRAEGSLDRPPKRATVVVSTACPNGDLFETKIT